MTEFFLIDKQGRILNAAQGDDLTNAKAAYVLAPNYLRGERVTQCVSIDQLREYERDLT